MAACEFPSGRPRQALNSLRVVTLVGASCKRPPQSQRLSACNVALMTLAGRRRGRWFRCAGMLGAMLLRRCLERVARDRLIDRRKRRGHIVTLARERRLSETTHE